MRLYTPPRLTITRCRGGYRWLAPVALAALAVSALVTLPGGAGATTTVARSAANTWPVAVNLNDTMTRTVRAGLGRAPVGGPYALTGIPARKVQVRSSRALVGPIPSAHLVGATVTKVKSADEELRLKFSLPAMPRTGGGLYLKLQTRTRAGGQAYRAGIQILPNGQMVAGFSRVHNHQETLIGPNLVLPQRLVAGRKAYLDVMVTGTNPTLLQVRSWLAGTAKPQWQLSFRDSSGAQVTGSGAVGFTLYTSRTSPATRVKLDQLRGWALGPRPTGASVTTGTSRNSGTGGTAAAPAVGGDGTARGSLPVGTARYPIPAGALYVSANSGNDGNDGTLDRPLRTVTAAIARATSGQTIVLRGGTYHESLFVGPAKTLTIQAYPGEAVWFDGSVPVTGWTQRGATWVATGWTAQFDHSASFTTGSDAGDFVNPAYPMAAYPDQVFLDGTQLTQVPAGTTPQPGQFAVDYAAKTITIGSNPAGHELRASDLATAFIVGGQVTLRGFGIRRYATPLPAMGTVFLGGDVGGDVLENLVVEDNATQGVAAGVGNGRFNHLTLANNGLAGFMANRADGTTIENSVLTGNNTQHFNSAPNAAGMKIGRTNGLVVRDNDVTDNPGASGIWTDISVTDFVITGNRVTGNSPYGIETELSDTGVVAGNFVSGARYGYTAFDTGNVQVYNNVFTGNSVWDVGLTQDERRNPDPATAQAAPWLVRNITVANNVFGTDAAFQFYALDKATRIPANSMNIVIAGNVFPLANSGRAPVMVGWGGSDNTTVTYYRSPSALNAGLGRHWDNLQPAAAVATANLDTGAAVRLPGPVASDLGVTAGTRHYGTF